MSPTTKNPEVAEEFSSKYKLWGWKEHKKSPFEKNSSVYSGLIKKVGCCSQMIV